MIINKIVRTFGDLATITVTGDVASSDLVHTCVGPTGLVYSGTFTNNSWVFSNLPHYGTYTVTMQTSSSYNAKTYEVTVDAAEDYSISHYNILYLYNNGDECSSITGGWTTSTEYGGSVTKNSSDLYLSINGTSRGISYAKIMTVNKISYTSFSKIYINCKAEFHPTTSSASYTADSADFRFTKPLYANMMKKNSGVAPITLSIEGTYSYDLSSASSEALTEVNLNGGYQQAGSAYVYQIWLV